MVSARQHDSAAAWASALAARLRLIYAGFVDESADQRRAFIADEVERAAGSVAPGQRSTHLAALALEFPAWQSMVSATADPAPVSPASLVNQLLSRLAELSPGDRARLEEAFAVTTDTAAGTHHAELWKKLGLDAARQPSPERAWRMLAVLTEFFTALDQLAWTLWRNMGVKSAFWKESDLAKLAGPYLAGDNEVSSEQVRQTVERTRRLIAALVGAPGRAASDVANRQAERLAPDSVEVAARAEKRALESLDAACWREYKQRHSNGGTASHLEAAMLAAVAQAAEDLIGGRIR